MLKRLVILAVLILVLLGGGYLFLNRGSFYPIKTNPTPAPPKVTNKISQIPKTGISIVVNEQNNSGESGLATVSEVNGKVVVNLKMVGFDNGMTQPAHLHSGTCKAPEDVVYPLSNVVNSSSETILDVDIKTLNSKLPLVLNVHKSVEESGIYVACGEVSL